MNRNNNTAKWWAMRSTAQVERHEWSIAKGGGGLRTITIVSSLTAGHLVGLYLLFLCHYPHSGTLIENEYEQIRHYLYIIVAAWSCYESWATLYLENASQFGQIDFGALFPCVMITLQVPTLTYASHCRILCFYLERESQVFR